MSFELLPHAFFTLPDGNRLRYAEFNPGERARGTVLAIPGRREFIEKKYVELVPPLRDMGFRVIIVEPRSQGLSSRFLSDDRRQRDYVEDFATHLNDLRAFVAAVVTPHLTTPLIVHGHSMGGHLALRWLAEDRPPVIGAFMTSPMLALASIPTQVAAFGLSWLGVRAFGNARDYAPTQHDYGQEDCVFADNPLTQDAERFKIIENYFTAHPDLTVGGVTWGWMLAALRSMHTVHEWHYLTRIDIPVLALVGDKDRVTPAADIAPYLNMIPRVRTHIIPNARHDLLNEIDPIRNEAWEKIGDFVKSFGMG